MGGTYLVVDIDNVIARTDEVLCDVIRSHSQAGVNLRYEDVQCFNYWEGSDAEGRQITKEEWHATIHPAFSEPAPILRIEPYGGIQGFLHRLIEADYQIHLVTSRLELARIPTMLWWERHPIPHQALHFVPPRTKHLIFRTCAASVEDDREQARAFAAQGIQSYLLAHPWNHCGVTDNIMRVQDWQEIVDDLTCRVSVTEI